MNLRESVAIVTGASSGIGEATARELARRGARVVVAARRVERLESLAAAIGGLAVAADVADRADLERLIATTVERFNRIDVLVNNAGIGSGGSLLRDSPEAIDRLFSVNVLAPVLLARLAVPHMRPGGVIVNIGSVAGEGPAVNLYSVTKAAMSTFSHSLRVQVARHALHVVLIEPGFIRTEMTAGARVPIPMPGPEVVARAVARSIERPASRTVIVPSWYVPVVWLMRLTPRRLMELAMVSFWPR